MKKIGLFLLGFLVYAIPLFSYAQIADVSNVLGKFIITGNDVLEIELGKNTNIKDGVGNFEFIITHKKTDPVLVNMAILRDGAPVNGANVQLYSSQIGEPIGTIKTVKKEVQGFTPGNYSVTLDYKNPSVVVSKKDFIVTADPSVNVVNANDYGLTVSVDSNQDIQLIFSGEILPKKDISQVQLKVRYKESSSVQYSTLPKSLFEGNLEKNKKNSFSYIIPALKKDTPYQIQIVDISRSPELVVKEFLHTTGRTNTPADSIIASNYGFPTISAVAQEKTATISGVLSPSKNIPQAQIYVYFGTLQESLEQQKPLFSSPTVNLELSVPRPFNYSFENLEPGTRYFYQVRDNARNINISSILSFTTKGMNNPNNPIEPIDGNGPIFDPNTQSGLFGNYSYPTNLGEPDSVGGGTDLFDGKPLVPCGKSTDTGDDATCRFKHVIILINNIINYLLVLMVPVIAGVAIYVGGMMIIKRNMPVELTQLKDRFKKIGIGILIMLLAWVLVATLLKVLVRDESSAFILLDLLDLE